MVHLNLHINKSEEHEQECGTVIIRKNCFLWQKMRKTRPKIQTDSPPPPIPKGKSVAQCFNYCWVYFQLMHIQQLEPRLESKGLRQRLGEPLQGWPHTHTHTHIIWCLNWTFQLQSPVLLHLLQSHGCFFPAPVLCSAQICVAG